MKRDKTIFFKGKSTFGKGHYYPSPMSYGDRQTKGRETMEPSQTQQLSAKNKKNKLLGKKTQNIGCRKNKNNATFILKD
jgi:hypothetical protein